MTTRRDTRAAADWALKAAQGDFSGDDATAFEAWLAADPARIEVFERASAALESDSLRAAAAGLDADPARGWAPRWASPAGAWGAAAAAAAAAMFLVLGPTIMGPTPPASEVSAAVPVERQRFASAERGAPAPLPGGGSLHLDADSAAFFDGTTEARRLVLTRGQAFVETGGAGAPPLRVAAGDLTLVPLGTAFDVERLAGGVAVEVHRGRVALHAAAGAPPLDTLSAGERAFVRDGVVTRLAGFDARARRDWRTGWLEVDREPLELVLARLDRRVASQIVVADEGVSARPVTGRYRLDQPEAALTALAAAADLAIERRPGVIVVRAQQGRAE